MSTITVTQATLDLINKAESDLGDAQAGDVTAKADSDLAHAAESKAVASSDAAAALHVTATASALTAIAALRAELQLPAAPPTP